MTRLNLETLGMSHESAQHVAKRKSSWMVLWLRERRDPTGMRSFFRRMHFAERNRTR